MNVLDQSAVAVEGKTAGRSAPQPVLVDQETTAASRLEHSRVSRVSILGRHLLGAGHVGRCGRTCRPASPGCLSQITGNHTGNEPSVAGVPRKEPPGFKPKPEGPFQTGLSHPTRGAADSVSGKIERGPDLDADRDPEFHEVPINPSFTLWLPERNEENVGPCRSDAGGQCILLLCGQLTKRWALSADDLKPRVLRAQPSSCFLGHSWGASQEKQAVSFPGRHGAQLEDQVRARYSLGKGRSMPARGPNQRRAIGDDEGGARIDRAEAGILLGEHRVVSVGRDEVCGPAHLDQVTNGGDGFGQGQRREGNTPNPDRIVLRYLIELVIFGED